MLKSSGDKLSTAKSESLETFKVSKKAPVIKRKYHTKSRKGCNPCKKRRVKCDEGKPMCNKCDHMGIECVYSLVALGISKNELPNSTDSISAAQADQAPSTNSSITNAALQLFLANATNSLSSNTSSNVFMQGLSSNKGCVDVSSLTNGVVPSLVLNGISATDLLVLQQEQQKQMQHALLLNLVASNTSGASNPLAGAAANPLASLLSGGLGGAPIASLLNLANSNELYPGLNTLAELQRKVSDPSSPPDIDFSRDEVLRNNSIDSVKSPGSSFHNSDIESVPTSAIPSPKSKLLPVSGASADTASKLNSLDLKLMYHYTTEVWQTITAAGISEENLWSDYIPKLAFDHPFLMHSLLAFSATHLSRTEDGLDECVTAHRGEALRLLRDAVLEISLDNTDALVASAIILIMDALANASFPSSPSPKSLPASAWIYHVKGAATILTAVWPLNKTSKFHNFISVDLSDLGDIINNPERLASTNNTFSELECFDESIEDLYPVEFSSPYLITLAYLDKLHNERHKSDFLLRIFAFPALLDKTFLALLMTGDLGAMRIMRVYYTMLREFTNDMRDKVWFLEGVCKVLPADVDQYAGGGGMHMMLDFLGGGLPSLTTVNLNDEFSTEFMN